MFAGVRLYQGLRNRVIPDYAMLAAGDFFDTDVNGGGIIDGLWCQSANSGSDIGNWQLPNGSNVSTVDDAGPLHIVRETSQVGLLRDAGIADFQGMYTCTIPDENGTMQTLVVWAAGNDAYGGTGTNCEFNNSLHAGITLSCV